MGTIPTNHPDHLIKNLVYPACAACVARLTPEEVALLDNILAFRGSSGRPRWVEWVNREVLAPGALA